MHTYMYKHHWSAKRHKTAKRKPKMAKRRPKRAKMRHQDSQDEAPRRPRSGMRGLMQFFAPLPHNLAISSCNQAKMRNAAWGRYQLCLTYIDIYTYLHMHLVAKRANMKPKRAKRRPKRAKRRRQEGQEEPLLLMLEMHCPRQPAKARVPTCGGRQ